MYAYFRGILVSVLSEEVVLEVSGVGYHILVPATVARQLPVPGAEVLLHVHLHVREDALQLYGFSSEDERQLFRLLLLVSGIGPKLALAVLSGLAVHHVHEAILSNNPDALSGVSGVGKKTAARVILELRDKILKLPPAGSTSRSPSFQFTTRRDDAVDALVTLGFPKATVLKTVSGILEAESTLGVEEVIKQALSAIHNS